MSRGRTSISLIAAALLVGNVTQASGLPDDEKISGEVRPTEALIYIVRQGEFVGKARTEKFFLEDQLAGVLPNNSYTFTYARPGTRLFWGSFHKEGVFLDLIGGQTYYLVFKISRPIYLVSESDGKAAVEKVEHYRTVSDEDRVKGGKEGIEKWPEYRERYAKGLAVGAEEQRYTPPVSTDGLTKVPSSAAISVELMENVSSGSSQVGDPVWVRVTENVVVNGGLFVRKGATVKALIRDVKGGGGFGREGKVDVTVVSVTAIDGTVSPLVGRVDGQGQRRSTTAAFLAAGAVGAFLVKGGQAFSPAGETATVYLREDVWIKPAEASQVAAVRANTEQTLRASLAGAVPCELVKGRGPKTVDVILDTPDEIASATLVEVDEDALPTPVEAIQIGRSKEGLAASFDGWAVCRYLRGSLPPVSELKGGDIQTIRNVGGTPLGLRLVTKDGTAVHARLNAEVALQKEK